jgi:hypothetical protein
LTIVSGLTLSDSYVGYKIGSISNGYVFFINSVVDSTVAIVEGNVPDGVDSFTDGFLRGAIKASFSDISNGVEYYLIGNIVYAISSNGSVLALQSWKACSFIGEQPVAATSTFHKDKSGIILCNPSGVFSISSPYGANGFYGYKINVSVPEFKINRNFSESISLVGGSEDMQNFSDASAYNYAYSHMRMVDSSGVFGYSANRLGTSSVETVVQFETPVYFPYYEDSIDDGVTPTYIPDGRGKFHTTVYTRCPISNKTSTVFTFDSSYQSYEDFVKLSDTSKRPYAIVTVGSISGLTAYFDFSDCTSMKDVARSIQDSINDSTNGSLRVKLSSIPIYSTGEFQGYTNGVEIYSESGEDVVTIDTSTSTGYNIFYTCFDVPSASPVGASTNKCGKTVKFLRYPGYQKTTAGVEEYSSNTWPSTHYGIYRSKDIYPSTLDSFSGIDSRVSNNPDILSWIEDVQCVNILTGSVTDGVLTVTAGEIKDYDQYCTIYNGGNEYRLGTKLTDSTIEIYSITSETLTPVVSIASSVFTIGGEKTFTADFTTTDGVTTFESTGYTFSASDIGKCIFWHDGTYCIVDGVADGSISVVGDISGKDDSIVGAINPTWREYYDTVTDNIQNGFLAVYPLKTSYNIPLPSMTSSAMAGGMLFVSSSASNKLTYSSLDVSIGYYHANKQAVDTFVDSILALSIVKDYLVIFTQSSTFSIPMSGSKQVTTEFGEAYTIVPTPSVIHSGVGCTSPTKIARTDDGNIVVFTTEPAIRSLDGVTYGGNIAEGLIQETYLQKMSPNVVMSYDKISGLTIWSKRS